MLYDEEYFRLYDEFGQPLDEWDEWLFNEMKKQVLHLFKTDSCNEYQDRESVFIGDTDRLKIGLDFSGGMPCLFVKPKEYETVNHVKEYKIRKEVDRIFKRLIKEYPGLWHYPTSAWATVRLKGYGTA